MVTVSTTSSGVFPDILDSYIDMSGTPGNVTINAKRGKVAIPSGVSSITVTNSYCTSSSIVLTVLDQVDGGLKYLQTTVASNGSFVISGNSSASSPVSVAFFVINSQ